MGKIVESEETIMTPFSHKDLEEGKDGRRRRRAAAKVSSKEGAEAKVAAPASEKGGDADTEAGDDADVAPDEPEEDSEKPAKSTEKKKAK